MRSVTPCDGTCWGLEMMSSTTQKPPFLRDGWFLIVKGISLIAKIVYIESYPDDEKNTYTHLQLSDYKARVYRASSMTKTWGPGLPSLLQYRLMHRQQLRRRSSTSCHRHKLCSRPIESSCDRVINIEPERIVRLTANPNNEAYVHRYWPTDHPT